MTDQARLYKWMLPNLHTAVQHTAWPVDVGKWTQRTAPVLCISGWHGVEERHVLNHLPSQLGAELWEIEIKGKRVDGEDKFAAEQMRLVHHLGSTTAKNLRLFSSDVAEDVIDLFEVKYPDDNRPRNAIEVARRFANGEVSTEEMAAARAAAWGAAGDAGAAAGYAGAAAGYARDAARDAARGAARVGAGYARDAAWAAAWGAAWDAACAAAWDAASDAARAAASATASAAASVAASAAASDAACVAAWDRYSNWLIVRIESGK